jgi:hypothetical protein
VDVKSKAVPCAIIARWAINKAVARLLPSSTASGSPSPLAFYKKVKGEGKVGVVALL